MIPGFLPPHQQVGIFPFNNNQIHQMQETAAAEAESQRVGLSFYNNLV